MHDRHDGHPLGSEPPSCLQKTWGPSRQRIGPVRLVSTDPRSAAGDVVAAALASASGEHVHAVNAWSIALADRSVELESVFESGWSVPDGRPLAWLSALRRDRPRLRQVRGPRLFLDVCEQGLPAQLRHYLLGGTPDVLERLERQLHGRFPDIRIVGAASPPFRAPTVPELAARDAAIRDSGAQLVWIGLGTPKQDLEAARLATTLPVVAVAVGAAFDFTAGSLVEAPRWLRFLGLEWAFRLATEPRRLWRRYLLGNVRFLRAVLRRRA